MPDRAIMPGLSITDSPVFLSPRETEALKLAAGGYTAREISEQMVVAEITVKQHLQAAREKLGARNTLHAVVLAIARGLIDIDAFLRPKAAWK
jgi:DNA-binding CsgD family transcriptional regulator